MPTDALVRLIDSMEEAARAATRPAPRLVAVAKTRGAGEIGALVDAWAARRPGATLAIGENYVQEAAPKIAALEGRGIEWHLVGHLQSNKAAQAAALFDWVQSVDRLKLVDALAGARGTDAPPLNVLIQVNVDGEAGKHGCRPEEVADLARAIAARPTLALRGLMAIPEPHPDHERRRAAFAGMRALYETLRVEHPGADTLSMGMSEDYPQAIAEGATMVRIGTALFGARSATDHVAFIGGGNMARSLIGGMVARGTDPATIHVAEPVETLREALARDFDVRTHADASDAVAGAGTWVFAVKPQVMRDVCGALAERAREARPLAISVAAGITTPQLSAWLGGDAAVVRAMPNTPALLGAGMTGLHANAAVDSAARERAQALLSAAGETVWIEDEALMDAVTAVSGSGPAYVFLLAEAMEDAAKSQGLPADAARRLVQQTLLGAARMLTGTDEAPSELRRRVTSPGGTTQAAIETFEAGGLRTLVASAIAAATVRGRALSAAND